jgi:hypothetical protein
MKTYIKNIKFCLLAIGLVILQSCTGDESIVNKFQAETTQGAILRTIKVNQGTFNFYDTSAKWSISIEEQDNANGKNMAEVKVYAKQTTGGVTKTEKFLKTYPASYFTTGPNGYPVGDITASLDETLTALGITTGEYTPSDKISMRLELVLTDGRTFSSTNAASTITGGVFFSSPFKYSVQFFCPLANAADFNGNYKVTADAWADYSVGDIVPVEYVAEDGLYVFRIKQTNNPYIYNSATAYLIVTINPLNASVTVASNEPYDYGVSGTDVTGTGTVGSCTGDINLVLKFSGGYNASSQTFNLVKQ